MPPFIVLAIAGVGLYAGYKWLAREINRNADPAGGNAADASTGDGDATAASRSAPKDLGPLEWDATAGVYRPRKTGAG